MFAIKFSFHFSVSSVVERLTFHGNILTKVLVSSHTLGETGLGVVGVMERLSLHSDVLSEVFISTHAFSKFVLSKVLSIVEWLAFHCNVLAEIFITSHALGKASLSIVSIVEWLALHGDILSQVFVTSHSFSELNEFLSVMEWLTLHGDVLAKILVASHSFGEEHVVWNAGNSWHSRLIAGRDLGEAGGGGSSLVVGEDLVGVWVVWRFSKLVSASDSKECKNSELHYN